MRSPQQPSKKPQRPFIIPSGFLPICPDLGQISEVIIDDGNPHMVIAKCGRVVIQGMQIILLGLDVLSPFLNVMGE